MTQAQLNTDKLSPVFERFNGKYSYDRLRIARLLLILQKLRFTPEFFSIYPSNPLFRSVELQTGVSWVYMSYVVCRQVLVTL